MEIMINTLTGEAVDQLYDIVKALLDLCNEEFINPVVKLHAGANRQCLYCGATEQANGAFEHSADCPVMKYEAIIKYIKKI